MGLETATYIDGLVTTNPTGTDPKSQGDDHLRLIKSTVKATFPNISGAVTPTHTELNYVDGVTSSIQVQIDTKGAKAGETWTGTHNFTGATVTVPTASPGDADTTAASTAFVDASFGKITGQAWSGTHTFPTQSPGTNNTTVATTEFATQLAFQAALPVQTGEGGKFLQTDGASASWESIANFIRALSASDSVGAGDRYKHHVLTSSGALSLLAAATAADGFMFYVRNSGTGVWTIDPDGSETIDGRSTIYVYPGEGFVVIGDGGNWRTFGRPRYVMIESQVISSSVASVDFERAFSDPEIRLHRFELNRVTSAGIVAARLKKSGAYTTTGYTGETWYNSGGTFSSTTWGVAANLSANVSFGGVVEVAGADSATGGTSEVVVRGLDRTFAAVVGAGHQNTAAVVEGVRFYGQIGDLTAGRIQHWGERTYV